MSYTPWTENGFPKRLSDAEGGNARTLRSLRSGRCMIPKDAIVRLRGTWRGTWSVYLSSAPVFSMSKVPWSALEFVDHGPQI